MSNKKLNMVTIFRIIFIVILQALLYRKVPIDVFFTACFLTAAAFWILPWLLSELIFHLFKIKEDFGGTLEFDDGDINDCRFRMIFNIDPEELAKEPTFVVNCKRTDLKSKPKDDAREKHTTW